MIAYDVKCEISGGKAFYSVWRGRRVGRSIKWSRFEVFDSMGEATKMAMHLNGEEEKRENSQRSEKVGFLQWLKMSWQEHTKPNTKASEDWCSKYKVNRHHGGGTGDYPKQCAREERRQQAKRACSVIDY